MAVNKRLLQGPTGAGGLVPSENFKVVTYDGNSGTQSITGVGFKPDFVWIKERDNIENHNLFDSTRGTTKFLQSNSTNAERTGGATLTSFDADGFTLGLDNEINDSGSNYVAWCWKAGGGTTSSNTDGDITSTVQANTDAGFSIVQYDGDGQNGQTVGHGLSSEPEVIIIKSRTFASHWPVYHKYNTGSSGYPEHEYVTLNSSNATSTTSVYWGNTQPTSSVFSIGTDTDVNKSGETNIAYCFHSVEGFSKFGKYTGNGSANGTIVETGFEPAFVLGRKVSGDNWWILDNKRNTTNPRNLGLFPNDYGQELGGYVLDFLSNGFQVKTSDNAMNTNGSDYIYMAFAADPDTEAPTLADSFAVKTYTGNGGTQSITGLGFSPSMVWLKGRSFADNHNIADTVRGAGKFIFPNLTSQEFTNSIYLSSFDSDGFTLGNDGSINASGETYVAWAWKADDNEPTIFSKSTAVAAYKFEDNSNDIGGSYNGTASNITYVSGGKFNKAVRGVASNSKVALNYTPSGAFTFSLWIYNESTSGSPSVIMGAGANWIIGWESNKVWMLINSSNRGSGYTISTNTWYHLGVTYNGSGTTQLYVDGTLRETITGQTPSGALGAIKLFQQDLGYWGVFEGRIDQVRIYDEVLSSTQISALYNESTSDNDTLDFPSGLSQIPLSTVSANANAGFSIVKFEKQFGSSVAEKIPHGLSAVPEMIILKRTDGSEDWYVYHTSLGNAARVQLNSSDAKTTGTNVWGQTNPSATVFTVESFNAGNAIAYCFHSVSGYSKISSYSGNGSTLAVTGLGFQPDWVIIKESDGTDSWQVYDSVRGAGKVLYPNGNNAEYAGSELASFDSDGFTVTGNPNENGKTYIYMAIKIN
jgi:hypothetical protein